MMDKLSQCNHIAPKSLFCLQLRCQIISRVNALLLPASVATVAISNCNSELIFRNFGILSLFPEFRNFFPEFFMFYSQYYYFLLKH